MSRILSVDPNNPDSVAVREIVTVLNAQGTVALPTDTVYGLAVDIFSGTALERLLTLKGRPSGKPIPIFISSIEALEEVVRGIPAPAQRLAQEFWPGPLTLILHASQQIPEGITAGTGTVGVRIPNLPLIGAVLTALGSSISGTSANRSGGRNPLTARDVMEEIGQDCDLIVDAGRAAGGVPSTVLDCTQFPFRLLREGAIGPEVLATVLGEDSLLT